MIGVINGVNKHTRYKLENFLTRYHIDHRIYEKVLVDGDKEYNIYFDYSEDGSVGTATRFGGYSIISYGDVVTECHLHNTEFQDVKVL